MKQKLTELKVEIENSTIIVGNINILLNIMDRNFVRRSGSVKKT